LIEATATALTFFIRTQPQEKKMKSTKKQVELPFPFRSEYIKFYNPREGRDQVMFIYSNALNGEIVKYRILR
jgi:hypothetical protein